MTSSLKKLKDLERSLTVSIEKDIYTSKFNSKISNLKKNVKLDGFRKGKVPNDVLEQRYGGSLHAEVLNDLIQDSYPKEIAEKKIRPANTPTISMLEDNPDKGIKYKAVFEVFPDIKPKVSSWKAFERHKINILDVDIDDAIQDILDRYGDWKKVDRNSAENDQVIVDFEGTIDGEAFDGNTAKDFKLVLGSKSMIPGFEDQLVDKKTDSNFEIKTSFPNDYFKNDLAGKEAVFKVYLKEVQENVPSKIDKDLYEKLAMEVKNENEFRDEIKKRMENESITQEKTLTKDSMYELLLKINKFSVPKCTVTEQSELMRNEALSRIGRNPEDESDNELFPLDTFTENAEKRVKLDLLFTALLNHYNLKVNQDDLKKFVEDEAKRYKDPKQFETWVYNQPKQLDQYRMIVLENQLVEKLDNDLKSKEKVINFNDLSKY
tara:strand:+ start:3227 stop:4528 length:1302 start_codon:yes stop_codon:yes gene_type:complete